MTLPLFKRRKPASKRVTVERCPWAADEVNHEYHDTEWGVPSRDDRHLFEMLILEGAQAGLSWTTILRKRQNYRAAFDEFDAEKIAHYGPDKIDALMSNAGIVRNRLKIESTIANARAFLAVKKEHGSFASFIWTFVGGTPIQNEWAVGDRLPARTEASDAMSKELRRRGFKFVGTTICYAYMQATGMVNDHVIGCPCRESCGRLA